ncbi:30S ribosomal protein S3ae [archaeon]|nr:30S ribosomal protein S3ae [archaeon]
MATKRKVDTWKTKKWYKLIAPPSFNEKELGETPANSPKTLENRTIKITLGEITEKRAQQYVGLFFKVNRITGEHAYTEIVGHELQRGYVGRQTRRMKSIVQAIFEVKTKDKKTVEVQVVCLAKGSMNDNQEKNVRKTLVETVTAEAKKKNFEEFFQEIVFGKLSTEVFTKVKKLFPISRVEIKKSRLKSEK